MCVAAVKHNSALLTHIHSLDDDDDDDDAAAAAALVAFIVCLVQVPID